MQHPYPASMVVAAGSSFSLNCTATGFPAPSIAWFLNDSQIVSANNTSVRRSSPNAYTVVSVVSVTRADLHHTGNYYCEATNVDQQGGTHNDTSNQTAVLFRCKAEV